MSDKRPMHLDQHDLERRIADSARAMWEQDGKPPGREREYRLRACRLVEMEENMDEGALAAHEEGHEG